MARRGQTKDATQAAERPWQCRVTGLSLGLICESDQSSDLLI